MKQAIAEKEAKSDVVSEDITSQIDKQVEQITKRIEIYQKQIEIKATEEMELLTVLKDYKAKFTDFEKATKKSERHGKQFEKELKLLS